MNNGKKGSYPDSSENTAGATGGNVRPRHDSESSNHSDSNSQSGKRQRTSQFSSPIFGSSPPKFVSLEEIVKASNGMKNLYLAHEIAVDKNFKLEKMDPPENSIQKKVKETFRKAFWDIFSQNLNQDPPNFEHAMVLLGDIKEMLFSVLLPQHVKLKQEINEVLDIDLIEQQALKGTLDFKHYANYVISVMGKLCAPVRDERIRELSEMTDIVSVFKGILETLDLMLLDMANFTIEIIRPGIIEKSVEYERAKFADFLNISPDGIAATRQWLLRHINKDSVPEQDAINDNLVVKKYTEQVLAKAYLELLNWDKENTFPEAASLDEGRFMDLGVRCRKLNVTGTVLLITTSCAPSLQSNSAFKEKLKQHITVLLSEVCNEKDVETVLPNIVAQIKKDVEESLAEHGLKINDGSADKLIESQILDITKPDHKIRCLVQQRIEEFLIQAITSPPSNPVRIPIGLTFLQTELMALAGQFLRLVSHNRAVFCEYYIDIVSEAIKSV